MKVLKIEESIREELNHNNIVICTYVGINDIEFDGIDISYKEDYPLLGETEIKEIE
jgi:hypothetical protein